MNKKKVARGTFFIFISRIAGFILGAILVFFLARILGPSKYGQYSVVMALIAIVASLIESGFTGSTCKFISAEKENTYSLIRFGFKAQAVWALIIFITVFVTADLCAKYIFKDISLSFYLRVAALYIIPTAMIGIGCAVLDGLRRFERSAFLVLLVGFSRVCLIILFIFLWRKVSAVFYAMFIASLLGLILLKIFLPKVEKKVTEIDTKKILFFAFTLIISYITLRAIFQIDKIFIKNILGDNKTVGFYSLASNFSSTLQFFVVAISTTLFPSVAASFASKDFLLTRKYLQEGTRYLLLLILPLSLGLAIVGKDIILLLFGQTYIQSAAPFSILIFASAFFSFFFLYRQLLVSIDKQWQSFFLTALVLLLGVILNPLFILKYGYLGAAFATFICSAIGAVVGGVYIFSVLKAKYPFMSFVRISLSAGVCFCLSFLATGLPYILRYTAYTFLVIFFVFLLYVTKEFKAEDRERIMSIFAK